MKRIEHPLKEGLPSMVYYHAFAKPISRYGIARTIYNIPKGHIPPTAKVSNTVRDMLSDFYGKKYLIESEAGILSDFAPLLDEIEAELKTHKKTLTVNERDELKQFLDKDFRAFVQRDYGRIKVGDPINAFSVFMGMLGSIVYTKLIINNLSALGSGVLAPGVVGEFKKHFSPQHNQNIELQAVAKISLSEELINKLTDVTFNRVMGAMGAVITALKR